MPHRRAAIFAGVLASFVCVPVFAQPVPPTPPATGFPAANVNVTAQDFVTRAAIGDKYEIRAARIAQRRSHNPRVAAFAARMIADHGRSSAKLAAIAARQGSPAIPARLDARHRGMIEQLQTIGARHFDHLYMAQQVQAHEEAAALFSSYAGAGDDPRLRRFAGTFLPVIRHHLGMARSLSFEVQHAR